MAGSKDHASGSHRLLSESRVANELGVSAKTLSDWRRQGTGPRWKHLGGRPVYRPVDVAAWLGRAARRPTASPISKASPTRVRG